MRGFLWSDTHTHCTAAAGRIRQGLDTPSLPSRQSEHSQQAGEPRWSSSGEVWEGDGTEGSQMLFYVWFEFTSWLRGVGQGKGAWDCFLTIWAWDSCAFCNGKIKELDYWEIQPLLGLLDHGKVPVIN